MNKIYTVTMVKPGCDSRCVGWFNTLYEAQTIVEGNYDLDECGYWIYCVIESVEGNIIYPCPPEEEHWYRFTEDRYKLIFKPDQYKHIVSFGIG